MDFAKKRRCVQTVHKQKKGTQQASFNFQMYRGGRAFTLPSHGIVLYLSLIVIPAGVCIAQCTAYLAMADMLDLLVATPHGKTTPALLDQAASTFLQACVAAGWQEAMHSKHHWLVHFGFHLQKFITAGLGPMLPNCFVNERKHKLARRYGSDIHNARTFEISVAHELLCHDLDVLETPGLFTSEVRLDKKCRAPRKLIQFVETTLGRSVGECFTCAKAFLGYCGPCNKGDVAIMKHADHLAVGQVFVHIACDGRLYSLITEWSIHSFDMKQGHAVCKKGNETFLISTDSLVCAVPWCQLADDMFRILVPWQHRQ